MSGAQVTLWDLSESALSEAATQLGSSTQVRTYHVDVASDDQVNLAFSHCLQAFGKVDILINSAGITGPNATTWEYPVDMWIKVLQVNLTGTFLCCRVAAP